MKEKISFIALALVGVVSAGIIAFMLVEFVLPVALPFLVAWLLASVTVGPANRLSKEIKVSERALRLMMSIFLIVGLVSLVGIALWQISNAVWNFISDLGEGNRLYDLLSAMLSSDVPILGDKIPEELMGRIREIISNAISSLVASLANGLTALVGAVPQIFFLLLVVFISLIYFSLDYDKISSFVRSILPERASKAISEFRNGILTVIKKYILSYSLILLITFSVMLGGFLLLGVEHAFLTAIVVALLDILPIIGVGTVVVPWSVIELIWGNKMMGIGLLVLFVVNAIIRQLAEPKIVGKNLNLHPIVTLILLYVGYSLLGVIGLVLLPVIAVSVSVILKGDNSAHVA